MPSRKEKVHLEIQTSRKNPVGIIRSSYWCKESKKIKHLQFGRIKGKSLKELKAIQAAMRGDSDSNESIEILQSKEFGATASVLSVIEDIELDKDIYSRKTPWVENVLAMIAGKLVFQSSKLGLCNLFETSALWENAGHDKRPDPDKDCYQAMDKLLLRQKAIQKKLVSKYNEQATLVLYDITSTYFEGDYAQSEIVKFGYNRDKKKGKKQVVVGLICSQDGCPLAIEIFAGNTKDESTVVDQINKLRENYGLKKLIFVGDRGMLTSANLKKCNSDTDLQTVTALTHGNFKELIGRELFDPELFDKKDICEIVDPEDEQIRYCVCFNPIRAEENRFSRSKLISLVIEGLESIADYKQKTTVEKLGARIGKLFHKYKMGKFFNWEIIGCPDSQDGKSSKHKIKWTLDTDKQKEEEALDGYFVVRTDIPEKEMNKNDVVKTYKSLSQVEQAFRNLKQARIQMRPIYHHRDDRIRAHLFLCMLAYHVQWHMTQRLSPLFENDGKGVNREWSLEHVFEELKCITVNKLSAANEIIRMVSSPTLNQQEILKLLQIGNIATMMKF